MSPPHSSPLGPLNGGRELGGLPPTGSRDSLDLADRRSRLIRAMADTAAAKGFAATTVADVVAAAEATRAEFYEQFRDEEECFLAAIDAFLAEVMGVVSALYSADKPWFQMTHDGVSSVLRLLARRPTFAKIAFLETPTAGEAALERYNAGKRGIISLIDVGRGDAPGDIYLPSETARIAFGGAEAVVTDELIAGRGSRLPEMLPEILYIAYVPFMPQAQAIELSGIDRTPRGESDRWEPQGPASGRVTVTLPGPGRRTDLIEAMLKICVSDGYERASVERVVAEAGITRQEFYEVFPDKQSCLLATYDFILDHVVFSVTAAFESEAEWPDQTRAAVAALLDWFSAEPGMARLAVFGMATAGPAAHRHYRKAVQRFLPLLAAGLEYAPHGDQLPPTLSRLALGSITGMLFDEIQAGRTAKLPERVPELTFAALLPFLGAEQASARMKRPPEL